jgi:hypothetical protein
MLLLIIEVLAIGKNYLLPIYEPLGELGACV